MYGIVTELTGVNGSFEFDSYDLALMAMREIMLISRVWLIRLADNVILAQSKH